MDEVKVDEPAPGVVRLRIDRPEKRNALSIAVRKRIVAELARIDADPELHAAILAGGEKIFAAGADISELKGLTPVGMAARGTDAMWDAIAGFSKPLIAAVRGVAFGGGFELAMCCDMIVAGEGARFGLPEVRLGLIPGGGGTQRLIRLCGKHLAMDVLLTGRTLTGPEAEVRNVVSRCVPDAEVEDTAVAMAAAAAAMAPLAVRQAKEAALRGADGPLPTGLALERKAIQVLCGSADFAEGVEAFLEKRPARFEGR
ncbi:MAG: enoyl-CoA hydratase-related protein [Alphaproteobacteria bacterium]|nr:enoyl-CoA hydratase-related protein [Alphaproteobacteria bacterium]MDX5368301.1 enoyl-CoA hydratase-related protein [Alphaproteobacteria bacterium]MDX5463107.1 enoyl-CoA hydratase-related protein [Alphaproteobacteria bacterium]